MQVLTTGVTTSLDSQLAVELHQLVQALGLQIQIHQTGTNVQIQEPGVDVQIPDLRVQMEELEKFQQPGVCIQIQQADLKRSEETNQKTGKVKQEKMSSLENVTAVENNLKEGRQLLKHKQEVNVGILSSQNYGSLDVKREKPVGLKEHMIKYDGAKELPAFEGPSMALEDTSIASETSLLDPEGPGLDSVLASEETVLIQEGPVLAAWKLRRVTIGVKRVKLNQKLETDFRESGFRNQNSETTFRDSGSPVVFDDSEEETGGSPLKPAAEEKILERDSSEKKENEKTEEKKKLEPVLMLRQQRERQKFITRSIINGIR